MQMTREHASRMHFDFHLFLPKILMIRYYDFVDMNMLEIIEIRWKNSLENVTYLKQTKIYRK